MKNHSIRLKQDFVNKVPAGDARSTNQVISALKFSPSPTAPLYSIHLAAVTADSLQGHNTMTRTPTHPVIHALSPGPPGGQITHTQHCTCMHSPPVRVSLSHPSNSCDGAACACTHSPRITRTPNSAIARAGSGMEVAPPMLVQLGRSTRTAHSTSLRTLYISIKYIE